MSFKKNVTIVVKVHILGGPGSGKTTLAHAIASHFHIPHYDLDVLGQRNGTDDAAWMAEIDQITRQPGWTTEGIYLLFINRFLYDADYVILLDIPWHTAAWRIIRRHITHSIRGTNRYPGLQSLLALLRYARQYYLNKRVDTAELTQQYLEVHQTTMHPPTNATMLTDLKTYSALVIPPTIAFVYQYLAPYHEKLAVVRTATDRKQLLQRLHHIQK